MHGLLNVPRSTLYIAAAIGAAVIGFLWYRARASSSTADTAGDGGGDAGSSALNSVGNFLTTAATRIVNAATSRGYRNNNPGNIRYLTAHAWNGQVDNDNGYAVFDTPQNGTRALGHQLQAYIARGLTTSRAIVSTWAPPSDGNDTEAYIDDVATQLSVGPDDDVSDRLADLAQAIARHENGYLSSDFDFQWVYLA